jgi:hypothetical protein
LLLAVVVACSSAESGGRWAGTIDTLPSGAVVVRNPETGIWDSASAWRIEEDLRIGTAGEGPASFSTIAALAVDGWGRVYVIDREAQEVRVFDSTGAFVRNIGRKGQGPGEFVGANGLARDPRGRLWVVDQQGERYTLFDTTGRVVEDHPRQLLFYAWRWRGQVDTAGRLLEDQTLRGAGEPVPVMLRFDWARDRTDTFPMPRRPGDPPFFRFERGSGLTMMSIPFTPDLRWGIDRRGHLWFGMNDTYRIYQGRLEGDTVRIIERAAEPIPVTGAEEDSVVASIVQRVGPGTNVDRSRIPDVKPAFETFWLDDLGRLWVLASLPAGESRQALDVFDSDGRYLGRVALPFRVSPYFPVLFRHDRVYAATEDAGGVPYVVRARIVGGGEP